MQTFLCVLTSDVSCFALQIVNYKIHFVLQRSETATNAFNKLASMLMFSLCIKVKDVLFYLEELFVFLILTILQVHSNPPRDFAIGGLSYISDGCIIA